MSPERMQQVTRLFEQALEQPESERAAFVKNACGAHAELLAEVESLLRHNNQAGSAFLSPLSTMATSESLEVTRSSAKSSTVAPSHPSPPALPDYDLIKFIGKGGFGEVWLGRQRITGVYCAIKIVPEGEAGEIEIDGIREYKLRASGHPHLVQIEHVGKSGNLYYYVMELADDARGDGVRSPEGYEPLTLGEELKRHGRLPPDQCAAIGIQLLKGLGHLHACGLLHRDIKPANVLRKSGRWILGDIGLATMQGKARCMAGTPPYLPPGGIQDQCGDLYSMGVLLTTLAAGSTPARDTSPADLVSSIPPTAGTLGAVISVACHQDPCRRYSSAAEMSRALEVIARSLAADRPGASRRWLALPLVLILALVGGWWALSGRDNPSPPPSPTRMEVHFKRTRADAGFDILNESNIPLPTGSLIQVHATLANPGYPYLLGISQTDPPILLDQSEDWPRSPVDDFYSPPLARDPADQQWHRLDPPAGPVMLLLVVADRPIRDAEQLTSKIQSMRCPDIDKFAMLVGNPDAPVFQLSRHRGIASSAATAPKGLLQSAPADWQSQFRLVQVFAFSHAAGPAILDGGRP